MNANIFEKTNQIIRNCDAVYLGVTDEEGYPSVSTVSVLDPQDMFEMYFGTNMEGSKIRRLQKNSKASVCIHSGADNVTLVGDAVVLCDHAIKSKYWKNGFENHFPGGVTDPSYCIIKFTTRRVSLWVDNESKAFTVAELLTVQSRCGLLCNDCAYKDSHDCKGCLALDGKPFWGECSVALCCMGKGHAHCGECADMPCDILNDFSCGNDEECDKPKGARIAVCKAWAQRTCTG
jgi:general stress protein 26